MNRKVRFGFVLTKDEKNALVRLAELEGGLSEAAMLRRLIRRAAKEQGLGTQVTTEEAGRSRGQEHGVISGG
ncbi:MAG: hypothetical protein HZB51_26435 [Chloroflexi bacterium]|nr:hypothetical protein [Chloroflexota bacterium]